MRKYFTLFVLLMGTGLFSTAAPLQCPDGGERCPAILWLVANRDYYGNVTLSGRVADTNPAVVMITFHGLPTLEGMTAAANSTGDFTLATGDIPWEVSGTFYAVAKNPPGGTSEPYYQTLLFP